MSRETVQEAQEFLTIHNNNHIRKSWILEIF